MIRRLSKSRKSRKKRKVIKSMQLMFSEMRSILVVSMRGKVIPLDTYWKRMMISMMKLITWSHFIKSKMTHLDNNFSKTSKMSLIAKKKKRNKIKQTEWKRHLRRS